MGKKRRASEKKTAACAQKWLIVQKKWLFQTACAQAACAQKWLLVQKNGFSRLLVHRNGCLCKKTAACAKKLLLVQKNCCLCKKTAACAKNGLCASAAAFWRHFFLNLARRAATGNYSQPGSMTPKVLVRESFQVRVRTYSHPRTKSWGLLDGSKTPFFCLCGAGGASKGSF